MAQIIVAGSGANVQRPTIFRGDIPRRDDATLRIPVEGVPAGRVIITGWLTAKTLKTDLDAAALFKLKITSVANADGVITDNGADSVGSVDFYLTPARLALITTWKYYDVQVALDNGDTYTIEVGQMRSVVASINPFSGRRSTSLVVRPVIAEPVPGYIGEVPNELITDVVANDNYEVIRTIKGLPAAATAARLTVRTNPTDADPGLFQIAITTVLSISGQITGAGDATQVRFIFTRAQTAQLATPRAFDIQLTAGGKLYTAALGTIAAPDDITDESGPVVTTVEVTPDPFPDMQEDQTVQLTAVAKDQLGVVMPGVPIVWASQTPLIASVNATGLVTGIDPGAAIIRATAPNAVFGEADGNITASTLPPTYPGELAWAHDPAINGGDQSHEAVIGPPAQLGLNAAPDSNDPTLVAGPPAYYDHGPEDLLLIGDQLDTVWTNAAGWSLAFALDLSAADVAHAGKNILSKDSHGIEREFLISLASGKIQTYAFYALDGTAYDLYEPPFVIAAGKHNFLLVWDPAIGRDAGPPYRLSLYVDGVDRSAARLTGIGADGNIQNGTAELCIGAKSSNIAGSVSVSKIGPFYAWPARKLTAAEAVTLHNWFDNKGWP